jgi:translocon-associated protein subunit delta
LIPQVSWTKDLKEAKSGDYEVNLYDDEGYSAVKRVVERGEDASTVKPLVTILINHPVSFRGPFSTSPIGVNFDPRGEVVPEG